MKNQQIRYLKHEFIKGIFERGDENDPKSPNILNYSLSCSKRAKWKNGQILHNFIKLTGSHIMYHSSIKVGKLLKKDGEWIGTREEIEKFLGKISLNSKGEPLDNGVFIFDGEFIETTDWKHGDMVDWVRTKNGKIPRGWISRKEPKKIPTQRFEMYEKPTDIVFVPFSEIKQLLKNKKMLDILSTRGLYRITDAMNIDDIQNDYVGSAGSPDGGIAKRWTEYISNGHGGNKKMIEESKKNPNFLQRCYFTVDCVFPDDYDLNHIQKAEANKKKQFKCTWN